MKLSYVLAAIGIALCGWGTFVSGTRYLAASESERAVHVLKTQNTAMPRKMDERLEDAKVKVLVQEILRDQKHLTDEVLTNFSRVLSGIKSESLQEGALWLLAGAIFSIIMFRQEKVRRA